MPVNNLVGVYFWELPVRGEKSMPGGDKRLNSPETQATFSYI